jgi:hypothetical protein
MVRTTFDTLLTAAISTILLGLKGLLGVMKEIRERNTGKTAYLKIYGVGLKLF